MNRYRLLRQKDVKEGEQAKSIHSEDDVIEIIVKESDEGNKKGDITDTIIKFSKEILKLVLIIPWTICVAPITHLILIYLLSFRATQLIGYWPMAWRDDPFLIGDDDEIYQTLIWCNYNGLVFALMLGVIFYFIFRCKKLSFIFSLQIIVLVFSILALIFDPLRRFDWWLD